MRKKTVTTKDSQPRSPKSSFDAAQNSDAQGAEDIVALILDHHVPLKELISTLKNKTKNREAKGEDFEEFAYLLTCHAKAEEEVLYVAMKNFDKLKIESFEGDTEHALADQLVQEINATPDYNEWLAKVKVLAEAVEHHIKEEEDQILKNVEKIMDPEMRKNLGAEYSRVHEEYQTLFEIKAPKMVSFKSSVVPELTRIT